MGNILKSKLFRAAAVVLLLAGLYALLGFYAAPRIVRSQAIDFVREKYGRELTLGEIRINPFKLQAEIKDLSLPDTDGKPMLAFRRLFVDFELSSLWQRAYFFKDVQLDAPLARAVIRAGRLGQPGGSRAARRGDADEPLPARLDPAVRARVMAPCSSPTWPGACRSSASSRRSISSSTTSGPRRKAARSDSPPRPRTPNCWSGTASSRSNHRSRRRANSQSPSLNVPGALEVAGVELPFVIPQGEMNLRGSYSVVLGEPMQLDVHLPQMQLNGLTRARAGSRAGLRHGADCRHQRHEDRDAGQYRVAAARSRPKASRPTSGRCPTAR